MTSASTNRRPRIILAGGAGFLGTGLLPDLRAAGYDAIILTRGENAIFQDGQVEYAHWDAKTPGDWSQQLDGAYAIINLVGRTVDCRKTAANKKVILDSRIDSVRALAAAWNQVPHPPRIWIQSATAHIYGDTGDEILDESSPLGTGFAPDVGRAWEKSLDDAHLPGVRKVILRISFVLGRNGGALKTLARLTRLFMGGPTGTGRQYMSWLHQADLNAILLRALKDESMSAPYILTAPNPVTNRDFMRMLRQALHRPWSPRVPNPLVRVGAFFMRTDPELAIFGRRLAPTRLMKEGYAFKFPTLPEAFQDLLSK